MLRSFLAIGAALTVVTLSATPSLALKGIEALDQCVKNATKGCKVIANSGGDIIIDGGQGGFVICTSLENECQAFHKSPPSKPKKEYQGHDGPTSGGGGVSGTGTGGGKKLGTSFPTRGPKTPGVIQ